MIGQIVILFIMLMSFPHVVSMVLVLRGVRAILGNWYGI